MKNKVNGQVKKNTLGEMKAKRSPLITKPMMMIALLTTLTMFPK